LLGLPEPGPRTVALGAGAVLLGGFAVAMEAELLAGLDGVLGSSPFRHMVTPGGFPMSVAMSNCGIAGWVSDRTGYRYDRSDPETGRPWPDMPYAFGRLAARPTPPNGLAFPASHRMPASSTATCPALG
jgi:DNA oxidative demethylase